MSKKELPKIVSMHRDGVVETLEFFLERAKAGEIRNFVIAGYLNDNEGNVFVTGEGTSVIEQQTLISYLQTSTTMRLLGVEG